MPPIIILLFVNIFALKLCSSESTFNFESNSDDDFDDTGSGFQYATDFLNSNDTDIDIKLISGRIIDGNKTTIDNFPWQVSLQRKSRHICGLLQFYSFHVSFIKCVH